MKDPVTLSLMALALVIGTGLVMVSCYSIGGWWLAPVPPVLVGLILFWPDKGASDEMG